MGNQQLYIDNEQTQVFLTALVGDGYLTRPKTDTINSQYSTNCIHKEYLEMKKCLLKDMAFNITKRINKGYKESFIYTLSSKRSTFITEIVNKDLQSVLDNINELGLALWFYDDGSLHKEKLFYNLNTQKFSFEDNIKIQSFLLRFGIQSKITKEIKKDGRIFYYQRISKFEGAYEISVILNKYFVSCYSYKIWSSETILKWSKMQEHLKSVDKKSNKYKSNLLKIL